MLKQFLTRKPKWQHSKIDVRKQAIEELTATDIEVLLTIAKEDSEPQLRCMAVRKISDLDLLKQLMQETHWEVKQLAEQRYLQLLAGLKAESPALQTRLAIIENLDNTALLEYLLRESQEVELRLLVLEKVGRDALYGDVAEKDSAAEVRLRAVEKITSRSTLERVMKNSRGKDKKVYRIAKEKLDAMQEIEERPKRLSAQREEVRKRLELLRKLDDWETSGQELTRVGQEWQRLAQEAVELRIVVDAQLQAQIQRFEQLFAECEAAARAYRDVQQAQAQVREEKQTVLEHLQALLLQLQQAEADGNLSALETQLDNLHTRWDYSGTLPLPEEQNMLSRFKQLHKQAQQQITAIRHSHGIAVALERLCQQAEKLLGQKKAVQTKHLSGLQSARQAIEHLPQTNAHIVQLDQRFSQIYAALEARLAEQQQQRKAYQQALKEDLQALEAALEAGEFQKSVDLEQKVRDLLDLLGDAPKHSKADWERRLQTCHAKIQELRGWQRWGNSLEREALCAQMEALIGLEADPEDLAKRVKDAQTLWRTLNDGKQDKALWERFNTACQKVYAPCHEHFAQRAQERRQNYEKKRAVCETLLRFAQETDWKARDLDWKAAYRFVQQQHKDWYQAGPTDRKLRKELDGQFAAAEVALEEHFSRERKRNLHQREALISKIKALEAVEDIQAALENVRALQSEWLVTVPGSRKEENQLWKSFQGACDAVFERDRQARQAVEHSLQGNQEAKEALCVQLEQLYNDLEATQEALPGARKKAEQQWDEIGEVPKKGLRKLEKRFKDAVRALERRYAGWQQQQQKAQLDLLRDKAALCAQLERLDSSAAVAVLETVRSAWEQLPPLLDATLQQTLEQRFHTACAHAEGTAALPPATAEVQTQQRLLCIRMELLAGIESPAEDKPLRMSYQVERLSKAMGGGSENLEKTVEAEAIAQQFYRLAPASEVALEQRLGQALQVLHEA